MEAGRVTVLREWSFAKCVGGVNSVDGDIG